MEKLAYITRGDIEDLTTYGYIVVVDSLGNVVYKMGDEKEYSFPRSSFKLIQAMSSLQNKVDEKFNFTEQEIAQMCASHSGEDFHIDTVKSMLKKIGYDESYLKCGAHYPYKQDAKEKMLLNHEQPKAIHNNCSGKHAGMLASCAALNISPDKYYDKEHTVQKQIISMISRICDIQEAKIKLAVDGCGVTVHALPIYNYALGMAKLTDKQILGEELYSLSSKITKAVTKHSEYMSGTDRIDHHVISKNQGKVIVKSGANGFFGGYLIKEKLGFAIKTYDNNTAVKNFLLIELLKKLEVIEKQDYDFFDNLVKVEVLNHRKEPVGYVKSLLV